MSFPLQFRVFILLSQTLHTYYLLPTEKWDSRYRIFSTTLNSGAESLQESIMGNKGSRNWLINTYNHVCKSYGYGRTSGYTAVPQKLIWKRWITRLMRYTIIPIQQKWLVFSPLVHFRSNLTLHILWRFGMTSEHTLHHFFLFFFSYPPWITMSTSKNLNSCSNIILKYTGQLKWREPMF